MEAAAPPFKVASEAMRERETFKYEPFLLADFRFNHSRRPFRSAELATSSDGVLTALTQLGVHQTGTERAFVSLFDASYQYFLAEATAGTPLAPGLPSCQCPVPLTLCGTAIPRCHGICEFVLLGDQSDAGELPVSVVPNLTADARFSTRPFCQLGGSERFYAAVPLRTSRGINIGVYCVLASPAAQPWNDDCARRLREISHSIMHHLGAGRSKHAYRRNERMNRGLGSFIEGRSTLSGWQHGPNVAAFADNSRLEGALDVTQQRLLRNGQDRDNESDHQAAASTAHNSGSGDVRASSTPEPRATGFFDASRTTRGRRTHAISPGSIEDSTLAPGAVFSKAANIIREAFEVAGCLFFDVTLGSYRTPAVQSPLGECHAEAPTSQVSSASSSDDQFTTSSAEAPDASCELLGFSTSDASSINTDVLDRNQAAMPRRFLAKLLRRYPNGSIFNFNAVGELQSGDSSEDDGTRGAMYDDPSSARGRVDSSAPNAARSRYPDRGASLTREGAMVHQAFPDARSVAFVPVWDSKRERWLAGGFVYTLIPTRVFTIEGELSFLKAFAKLVAAEVHNLETLRANKAKSDALDSLSHELRSPLHGVILGTELLNDTELSVFQSNAIHTIETCCRTLLDTTDHLLDYSKVNSLAVRRKQAAIMASPKQGVRARSDQFGKKNLYTDARLDGLVEEVVESIFAGYNFQRMSIRQMSTWDKSTYADRTAHNRLDTAQAMEQLDPGMDDQGEHRLHFGNVSVYLIIDPTCDWMFLLPCGAIRRIVMNLFGNSLKFTAKGSICISLSQEKASSKRPRAERSVKLTVEDTGKGISDDYIRHRLFKPFSQEDELAPGTGLGLSLVKAIVSELRGKILIESQVGTGTKTTVTLPLEQSSSAAAPSEDDKDFDEIVQELGRLRVRLCGFGPGGSHGRESDRRAVIENICRHSLRMDIVSGDQARNLAPDMVLWLDGALPESFAEVEQLAKTPNVVICQDALVAYRRSTMYESAGHGGVFDFISQPIGPRKLANSMQLAYKRWMGLSKLHPPAFRPPGVLRCRGSLGPQLSTDAFGKEKKPLLESTVSPGFAPPCRTVSPEELAGLSTDEGQIGGGEASSGQKILVVDDNHINLKILSAHLGKLDCAYEVAVNGKQAIDAYKRNPFHWAGILMDISMPVMDGLEATRQIRGFEQRNQVGSVAILALTGLASDRVRREALESGVDILLTKPVRLKTLDETLKTMGILPTAPTKAEPKSQERI